MPKIFIIEDDANVLASLEAKLSLLNFIVKTDNGSAEISEIIREIKVFRPDFIVLDLVLPKNDGFQILKAIKSDNEIAPIDVLIFTNLVDQDSRAKASSLGVSYYFTKDNFTIDSLVNKIQKIIQHKN